MPAPASLRHRVSYGRALAATGLAYAVLHHLGALPGGLGGAPRGTRWTDWLDLLVPYAVLAPAALTVHLARSSPTRWAVFGAGAVAYADGHGLHLAANSVGNAAPGEVAHLWDETVGHLVWYAGAAVVAGVLAATTRGRPRPAAPLAWVLAVAVGLTWATNAVGGGTVVASLLAAVALLVVGWRGRSGLPAVLLAAAVPACLLLVGELLRA